MTDKTSDENVNSPATSTDEAPTVELDERHGLEEAKSGTLYERLTQPFEVTFRDVRGGVEIEYITGEQATSRANNEFGVGNWSFRVIEHGIQAEADECWVLGEVRARIDGEWVAQQQFGSQKVKRSRSSGTPLDIGFDLKGAATDALKKCLTLFGIGLYLYKKEQGAGGKAVTPKSGERGKKPTPDRRLQSLANQQAPARPSQPVAGAARTSAPAKQPTPIASRRQPPRDDEVDGPVTYTCQADGCGQTYASDKRWRRRDDTTVTGQDVATESQLVAGKVLCPSCLAKAKTDKAAAR